MERWRTDGKMVIDKEKFEANEKEVTVYPATSENSPMLVLNTYIGDGESVYKAMQKIACPDCNLIVVGNLKWDHDMTPWYCPPLGKDDTPCTGGANEYIEMLLGDILPKAKKMIKGSPVFTGIAGYSLAGLFAVYAMYQCDVFDRVASMSGSLWFPDFKEYTFSHETKKKPEKMYFSLGDAEAKTRNRTLKTVQDNTMELVAHYKEIGIDVTWEQNSGNHLKDADIRSAKGIACILQTE